MPPPSHGRDLSRRLHLSFMLASWRARLLVGNEHLETDRPAVSRIVTRLSDRTGAPLLRWCGFES